MRRPGSRRAALFTFVTVFIVLVANGRPIGSGDTNSVEQTARALVERGTFVLEGVDARDNFTRPAGPGRVSVYSPPTALVAAPMLAFLRVFFDLSPTAVQVAGKLVAALLSAFAMALLAWAFSHRVTDSEAMRAAVIVGVGTSVYSASQALWQHPLTVLSLTVAALALERLHLEGGLRPGLWTAAGSLALSMAAAARPATLPMVAVLFLFLLSRARSLGTLPAAVMAALPIAVAIGWYNHTFFGAPWNFGASTSGRFLSAFPESLAGLLISPARGLFVFTPVAVIALIGVIDAARRGRFGVALAAGAATHIAFVSLWNEWHGGESFGPRLLTDMIPLLFYFLPEALRRTSFIGYLLAIASIVIQLLGGWTYDYRWERLHQRGRDFDAALWNWRDSPVPFALREGAFVQGIPTIEGRRLHAPVVRWTPYGSSGSTIDAASNRLTITGNPVIGDVVLVRGARIESGSIRLTHPADAISFRVREAGLLGLSIEGRLLGTLAVDIAGTSADRDARGTFATVVAGPVVAGSEVVVRAASGDLRIDRISANLTR